MEDSVIEPVLTAEDWADVSKYGISCIHAETGPVHWGYWSVTEDAQVMAIANYALADDSPYKITREDVTTLRLVVGVITRNRETAQRMSDLADKLDALLPPETP